VLQHIGTTFKVDPGHKDEPHGPPVFNYNIPNVILTDEVRTVAQAKGKVAPDEVLSNSLPNVAKYMSALTLKLFKKLQRDRYTERLRSSCQ